MKSGYFLVFFSVLMFVFSVSGAGQEIDQSLEGQGDEMGQEQEPKVIEYPGVDPERGGVAPLIEQARKSKRNVITWPGFQMARDGKGSRVFVQILKGNKISVVTEPVRVKKPKFKVSKPCLVYEFSKSVVLLRNNYNPLITIYFNTPVKKAKLRRFRKRVYLVIELRENAEPIGEKFVTYKDDLYFFFVEFAEGNYLPHGSTEEEKPEGATGKVTGKTEGVAGN